MQSREGVERIVQSALQVIDNKIVKPKILKQGDRVSREFLQNTKPILDSFHYKQSDSFRSVSVEAPEPVTVEPPASLVNSVKVLADAGELQYGLSRLQA